MSDKLRRKEAPTLVDKIQVYQWLSRAWSRHLANQETCAVLYLVDRTIGWGRDTFTAPTENILTGTEEYASIGLSRRLYFLVMASLEEKGIITRRVYRGRSQITLNVDWLENKEIQMLPIPKRMKTGGRNLSSSAAHAPEECSPCTVNTVVGKTSNEEDGGSTAFAVAASSFPLSRKRREGGDLARDENQAQPETGQFDTPPVVRGRDRTTGGVSNWPDRKGTRLNSSH